MPVGHLLKLMGGVQQASFGEVIPNNLQAYWKPIHKPGWNGHGGDARQVDGNGKHVLQVHGHRIADFLALDKGRGGRGRAHQHIHFLEGVNKVPLDQPANFLSLEVVRIEIAGG